MWDEEEIILSDSGLVEDAEHMVRFAYSSFQHLSELIMIYDSYDSHARTWPDSFFLVPGCPMDNAGQEDMMGWVKHYTPVMAHILPLGEQHTVLYNELVNLLMAKHRVSRFILARFPLAYLLPIPPV
jgi:hypothetical protein